MKKTAAAWIAFGLTLLAYLPTLLNGFVDWDDERYLLASRAHLGFALSQLKWMFTTTLSGPYQPLSWMSLALDYSLWGAAPWAFHLTGALLHAANAALVFLIARELFMHARPDDKDGALNASALFAALVFSLHPLRVESVAWASERRDVLCGFFSLLAVLWYLRPQTRVRTPAAFLAALLSKGMAVSLPLVFCALDFFPLRRRAWKEKVVYFGLSTAFGCLGWLGQQKFDQGRFPYPGLGGRLAQAAYGLVFYVEKTVWPAALSPLYLRPAGLSLFAWPFWACVLLAAAGAAAVLAYKRSSWWTLAAFAYAASLLPVLGLVPFGRQLAADRYSYLPCVPLALLAGAGLRAAWKKEWSRPAAAAACLALAVLTLRQEPVWRDSASLWTRVAEVEPAQPMPHNSLGFALAARGRLPEAEREYRASIALDPSYELPRNNLGNLLAAEGKLGEAEEEYRAATALKPDYWEARSNLGLALARQNKLKEAAAELEQAARLAPGAPGVHKNLGLVYQALGKKALAAEELARAQELRRVYSPQ